MLKTQNLQSTLDIQSILEGCIIGQKHDQDLLYKKYAPLMFSICLRYAKDYATAEDILQEGFIKVFSRINCYRGTGSFEGWMKRIFINTAIEHYRRSSHYQVIPINECYQFSIDATALQNLLKEDLISMIQSLPEGYRNVFNLYVIDGYNHGEIAKILKISEGTSKSQLARARKALKKRIIKLDEARR